MIWNSPSQVLVIVIIKQTERFVWIYDEHHVREVLCSIGRHAADPTLSMTWGDAAMATMRVKNLTKLNTGGMA